MAVIVCPNKACGAEIPDDSAFCEECGSDIYRCTNPDVTHFSVDADPYCAECGAETVRNGGTVAPAPQNAAGYSVPQNIQNIGTEIIDVPADPSRIFFRHSEGWNMELADGDILGRTNGNHTDRLGSIKVISGTHARISHTQDGWYITDQKSLNKTWVNNQEAPPFQPVKIKQNDVVTLANAKFTVMEL